MIATQWQDLVGTTVSGRYVLRDLVSSSGSQAEFTASVTGEHHSLVSVALVDVAPGEIETEIAAINRAKQLRHPNILQVIDGGPCVVESANLLFVVTEPAQGTLAEALDPNPSELLQDLLSALDWLHSQELVYRNLDPETVVRAGSHWKLADLSQVHSAGKFDTAEPMGRPAPPEAAAGLIVPAWDIWTLGILLRDLQKKQPGGISAPFDSIVRGCLEPDYQRRISSEEIQKLLKPVPVSEPIVEPGPAPTPALTTPSRSRVPVIVLSLIAVLVVLLVVLLRPRHPQDIPTPAENPTPPPPKIQSAAPVAPSLPPIAKPAATPDKHIGRADYFADDLEGNLTASGEPFSNDAMTAASREFPLGTRLRVTNLKTLRSVTVRVNDRGAFRPGFVVTVTRRAAEELGFVKAGSARVKVELVK